MADDLDVEAMLEAPYKKEENESERNGKSSSKHERSARDKDKDRSKDKDKDRSKDKDRRRRSTSKSRDRKRSKSRDRHRGSPSKSRDRRRRSRSKSRDRRRSSPSKSRDRRRNSPPRHDRRRRSPSPPRSGANAAERRDTHEEKFRKRFGPDADYSFRKRNSEGLDDRYRKRYPGGPELTPEERDARTVFCMQLASSIRPRDLEEFFSSVGKVRDCRIITDNKTRKSKGIAYIEFERTDCVALALGLTGQKLKGIPILVQVSQAEKNRQTTAAPASDETLIGPMRLYVGSLHFNITEDMLRGIFEPFGKIDHINLVIDPETNRSKGFGFVTFNGAEDARKALDQLNGFELAGRPMKVGHVTERAMEAQVSGNQAGLDTDEMDRAGVDLGATGRLQLMAKLAESSGMPIPRAAASALNRQANNPTIMPGMTAPPIATQCFMLSNMFSPETETNPTWDSDIRDDVIDECNKHGGVLHIYVDKVSPQGNVYVKCPTIAAAAASVQALHGRFFAGKVITAAYVPLPNYHQLFADSQFARQLLMSSQAMAQQQLLTARPLPPMY